MFDLESLDQAAERVYAMMAPTPQHQWPLLSQKAGAEVWLKHENCSPVGSFKVRGGINYVHELMAADPSVQGLVAASTGNHGQSVVFSARRAGLEAVIVVPEGANPEKCAAMAARGAELVYHGKDFNEAFDHAHTLAEERGWHLFESYHPHLVQGVSTYALELFRGVPDIDTVYVPIGMGSGCNGVVAARDALGLDTVIVGVVAEKAPAYLHSFANKTPISTNSNATFAEGLAVRIPHPGALAMILEGVERVVAVSEDELAQGIRDIFACTHHVAEGAGASTVAAIMKERDDISGQRVAAIISGGNIDTERYLQVLSGHTPPVA